MKHTCFNRYLDDTKGKIMGRGGWGMTQAYVPPPVPPRIPKRLEGYSYREIIQNSALK